MQMFSNRQAEIIEKSIGIIANKGIQGLTIKNLSKEIGISEPAIYRHFDSKTAILIAILDTFEDMSTLMGGLAKNSADTAPNKIAFIFSSMTDIFMETPALVSVIFAEEIFKNELVLKEKITSILNNNEDTIEGIIKNGQKKGEVRSDMSYKNLALIIMGSLRLIVKRWDLNNFSFDLKKEGKELMN
ncbi:MAG: TetR family transcriptional regulator [Bacteroidales bacterium]|nr:TetR family transcriptional regulator [Bacteroidales bacterium]